MTQQLTAPAPAGPTGLVDDRPHEGFFRVHRAALAEESVFEAERRTIFDRCWLYVGHTSEVPRAGDYRARTVADRPLILWRDQDGQVRVFLNSCRHRGAQICRVPEGNARGMTCFYHAWTYASDGRLTGLPGEDGYGPDFDRGRFGLASPPQVAEYRGFVFCCFDPGAVELTEYLGRARDYIDLVADQSPEIEVVEGVHEYSMSANWKLFVENSLDGYHLLPLHRTYFDYLKSTEDSDLDPRKPTSAEDLGAGHAVITFEGGRGRGRWRAGHRRWGRKTAPTSRVSSRRCRIGSARSAPAASRRSTGICWSSPTS